ncbi:lactose-binding lectin l-2-like isoform X2 [Argopecten irradians]|uniref:lactose-binding lectin l-2-like isoform X2 n=1 Tax=Argopecten irradians TaxID=31199 RepID=UPI0037214945
MALLAVVALLVSVLTFCEADCPDGFSKHGGSCYKAVRIKATWAESDVYCHSAGADLATIETAEEQHYLEGHLSAIAGAFDPARFWFGGNDFAEEGTWVWAKSKIQIVEYTNWRYNAVTPIDKDENCLELSQGYDWQWNDNDCDDRYFFVCEKDAYIDGGEIIG